MNLDSSFLRWCLFIILTFKFVICTSIAKEDNILKSNVQYNNDLENNRAKRGLSVLETPTTGIKQLAQSWAEKQNPLVEQKRRWKDMAAWGKRKWSSLSPWGKRRWARLETWGKRSYEPEGNIDPDMEQADVPVDKRAWDKMATWGKRASDMLNEADKRKWTSYSAWGKRDQDLDDDGMQDSVDKRKWSSLAPWGKRDRNWSNFAPWGKRGKWEHLSAWGKRGGDQWKSFSAWGKRDVPEN